MRRTIAIFIGVSIALSVGYAKLLPEALGAPDLTYQKSLMPITGSVYELGTTSRPWLRGTFDELCLTSSTCISSWLAGGGGGGGFPLYIQNGGATQNVGTTTLNFTPNSFSLTESPDDTFSIRVSTTTLGLLASSISDFVSTVRTSISETILGIGYDSGTGIFSLDSGYTIPTTTRANNWDTAFSWGNHASAGYDQVTTAGDGLTRTLNDFDCDTGSGSVFGCITAADWVTFNSKVSSTSIDTSNELLALLDDETGTAGSLVFSGNPLLQGFRSNASSTIGDGTGIGGLTILGNATTTGNAYFAGNVGIGTSTPSSRLNVYGNTENLVRITNSAATAGRDWNIAIGSGTNFSHGYLNITQGKPSSSNYELQFQGSGVVQARMAFSAPSFNSTITGRGASPILAWTNDGGNFNGTLDVGQEYINGDTNLNNWINGTGTLAVKRGSDSATLMTILSANGNVGIGSSSPSRRLTVSGDIYSTGNLTAASSTLGNATSTSLAITGISGSTQCLRVNASGVVSGTGADCGSGAGDGMSNWSLVNGALTPTTTTATYGIRVNASSTIGDGTGAGGLTILGNSTTTGNAYFAGNVGVGNTTPGAQFHVGPAIHGTLNGGYMGTALFTGRGGGTNNSGLFVAGASNSATGDRPLVGAVRARGTLASPTAVQNGDELFSFLPAGYDGASLQYPAMIDFNVDGAVSSGVIPTSIDFITGSNSGTRTSRLKVTSAGNVGIGSSSPSRRLTVSGDIYSTGNLTAASSTLGNATSTSLAITGISGSTQCLRVNSSGVVSGTGSDCASGADGMSNWSLVNGALTPTTTTATYGIRVNASSTIGGGTAVTGLTISGGATTTGNHLIMGSATSTTSFFSALGTFTNSVINTLLTAVNATITGVLTIPNGTGPTSDDPGEISHDTSDNQLILDDYVIRTKEELYQFSVGSTSPAFVSGVTKYLPVKEDGYVVTDIYCTTEGGTNKAITVFGEAITCDGDGAADDGSISIATVGAASTTVPVTMGATSGTVNYVNVTITGKYVRE